MKKRKESTIDNPLTVDIEALQGMLNVGETTARNIGRESGALVKIGRRSLYRVDRIKAYLETR